MTTFRISHDSDTDIDAADTVHFDKDVSTCSCVKFSSDKIQNLGKFGDTTVDTQEVMTQQILLQLLAISKGLDNIENGSVKKTIDEHKIKKSSGQKQKNLLTQLLTRFRHLSVLNKFL